MSIYNNPKEYADTTRTTLEQAKVRCEHFKKVQEAIYQAKKCPRCGKHTIEYEGGSYEEGTTPFVFCDNYNFTYIEAGEKHIGDCEFTSQVAGQFKILGEHTDFDVVLMLSTGFETEGLINIEKEVGCSWDEFVEKQNAILNL